MQQIHIQLGRIDYLILLVYFAFVIGIGWVLKRYMKGEARTFFPFGALDNPRGSQVLALHLREPGRAGGDWHGGLRREIRHHDQPFLLGRRDFRRWSFLAIFMMPFYLRLESAIGAGIFESLRFDEKTRGFNAISFAVMTVFSSGISLHALAKLLQNAAETGTTNACIAVSASIVAYLYLSRAG